MEFLKKHWWKILIAVVIVWVGFKMLKSKGGMVKTPGQADPGSKTPNGTVETTG